MARRTEQPPRIRPHRVDRGAQLCSLVVAFLSGCYRAVSPTHCDASDASGPCDVSTPHDSAAPADTLDTHDTPLVTDTPPPQPVLAITLRTGHDDLRSDSALDAIVTATDGSTRALVVRAAGEPAWTLGTISTVELAWDSVGVSSIQLRLVESDPNCSLFCDNWDLASIDVALVRADGSRTCVVHRVGVNGGADNDQDAVVRLVARDSGGFSNQVTFAAATGCP
jgi:hypothetical protein